MADDTPPHAKVGVARKQSSIRAELAFRARLGELGATLLDLWLGNSKPHRVICANGHLCTPRPASLQQGRGPCRTCSGTDPKAAEATFRARVEEVGGTVLEPVWLGVGEPHLVRCAEGHDCTPRPTHVRMGHGLCKTCAGQDTRVAEARFRKFVDELGGTVIGPWKNTHTRVRVRCRTGHGCSPLPYLVFARGRICRTCARRDPEASWAAFHARVEELGGTVLEPTWKGALSPHKIRCSEGHESTPRPGDVGQGQGICFKCRGRIWDVFYVVVNDVSDVVKFGVTSGTAQKRLADHARDGFVRVVRIHVNLPGDTAPELERTIVAALKDAREKPVRGREYYPAHVIALVLDLVDNHPAILRAAT